MNQAATAYFPLVLLTSGSVASSACNKLKRKIGSTVRPRLTAFARWSFHVCDGGNAMIAPIVGLFTWWWWSAERGNKSTIILMALFNLTRRMNHLFSSYDSQEFDSLRDSRSFLCLLLVTEPRTTLFVELVLITFILSLISTSSGATFWQVY